MAKKPCSFPSTYCDMLTKVNRFMKDNEELNVSDGLVSGTLVALDIKSDAQREEILKAFNKFMDHYIVHLSTKMELLQGFHKDFCKQIEKTHVPTN